MAQDTIIQQVSIPSDNITIRRQPTYLVSFTDSTKKNSYFVATKYEEGTSCAKLTGFSIDLDETKIVAGYDDIIKGTDKENFVEMFVPWHRIKSVRSLVFRQK
jgi:hypothetical protein